MLTLTSLPVDIIIIVFESLGLHDFTALSLTCHLLYSVVSLSLAISLTQVELILPDEG